MIKGILALFSSGIIFRLPVLCGIIVGFYLMFTHSDNEIFVAFHNPSLYFFGLSVCIIYAFFFKPIYKTGGGIIDWHATFYSLFGHFISYVVAVIFSCLFIFTVSFGGFDNENDEQTEIDGAQINEIINDIKQF